MKKKNSKLVAWRLSEEARTTLALVAKETGMTKSEVVELCIAKHAIEMPALAESVKKPLIEFLARELSQYEKKK